MLRCGMFEMNITPPFGSSMPGYLHERKSTGLKDELYVKALAVESGDIAFALIVADALYLQRREVQSIRERVRRSTGIPPERIMVSATHTHTGPPIRPGFDGSTHEAYLQYFVEKAADTAVMAYERRVPARIGFGSGYEGDIAFNRRYWMKDGTVRTNPGFQHPQLDRPAGPTDPEVLVVRVDDLDGRPIGVVTNFACHTDTVGGTEYCADFPGELSRTLKNVLGERTVSLFVLGACGNINHYDFSKPREAAPDHYRTMGRILAGEVLKVREKIRLPETADAMEAAVEQTFFPIKYTRPTAREAEAARQVLASGTASETEKFFADQLLQVVDNPEDGTEIEIQAFRLGELAVVGLPGEIFVEFGLSIKSGSPYRYNMINTLCNGSTTGYVCTREAYEQGGYEPRLKNNNRNPPGAGEQFVEHALRLLGRMNA